MLSNSGNNDNQEQVAMKNTSDILDNEEDDEVPCFKCGHYQLSDLPSPRLGPLCHLKIGSRCWCMIKTVLLICLILFLIVLPAMMLYSGITYDYCGDIFSTWLLVGGVLAYLDSFIFLVWMFLRRKHKMDDVTYTICDLPCMPCFLGIFAVVSITLVIWWSIGQGRLFSGSIIQDPVMEDPVCKLYLFTFPYWLCILPYLVLFLGCFACFAYIVCGC